MIVDPITMRPEQQICEALEVMARYRISGVPVTRDGKAVGILTNRDLRFVRDTHQEISSVMTREDLVTVPPGTTLERAKELLHQHRIEKLLVVDDERTAVRPDHDQGHREDRALPHRLQGRLGRLLCGAAVGVGDETLERAQALRRRRRRRDRGRHRARPLEGRAARRSASCASTSPRSAAGRRQRRDRRRAPRR